MRNVIAAIIIAAACAACIQSPPPTESRQVSSAVARLPNPIAGTTVSRVDDPEHGVVCYVSDGYKAGGISCIKLN